MNSIKIIDVPDAGDAGPSSDWSSAYRRWLVMRGFASELKAFDSLAQVSKRRHGKLEETQSAPPAIKGRYANRKTKSKGGK
jgi:hypothetical protein